MLHQEFLTNFDAVNSLSEPSGRHSNPKSQKDRDKILEELMKRAKVFGQYSRAYA